MMADKSKKPVKKEEEEAEVRFHDAITRKVRVVQAVPQQNCR